MAFAQIEATVGSVRAVYYTAPTEGGGPDDRPVRKVMVLLDLDYQGKTITGYGALDEVPVNSTLARVRRRLSRIRPCWRENSADELLELVEHEAVDLSTLASAVGSIVGLIRKVAGPRCSNKLLESSNLVGALVIALIDASMKAREFDDLGLPEGNAVTRWLGRARQGEGDFNESQGAGIGIVPDWPTILSGKKVVYVTTDPVEMLEARKTNVYENAANIGALGPNGAPAHAFAEATLARRLGMVRYTRGSFLVIDDEGREFPFMASRTQLSGLAGSAICNNKETTRVLLSERGVPTAKGRLFGPDEQNSALEYAESLGFPVVLKPAKGFKGIGVFANIRDREALAEAFELLEETSFGGQDFLVEEHVAGEEYRILVVGGEAVAAIHRSPASVVGDGKHVLAELILRKNLLRRFNPSLRFRPIVYDSDCKRELAMQRLELDQVVAPGQLVTLSSTSNLSQGGDSTAVLEQIHPSILEASVQAVDAIPNLGFAGVDFLVADLTKPLTEQKSAVLEVNAHASISGGVFPMFGQPQDVAGAVLDALVDTFAIEVPNEPVETVAVEARVRGTLPKPLYEKWILQKAQENNVVGSVTRISQREVQIQIQGDVGAVATMVIAANLRRRRTRPTSTTVTVLPEDLKDEQFTVGRRHRRGRSDAA